MGDTTRRHKLFNNRWMERILITTAFILLAATAVVAQEDSTRYINGLPVSEDDTAQRFPQRDLHPKNELAPVQIRDVPAKLLEVLKEEEHYRGWQDSTIYFDSNTGLYLIPIRYAEGVKVYGLNEDGHPVTFSETSAGDDQ